MTRDEFAEAVAGELLCGGVSFDPAELWEFARDVWPLAREDPEPARWARVFFVVCRLDRVFRPGDAGG